MKKKLKYIEQLIWDNIEVHIKLKNKKMKEKYKEVEIRERTIQRRRNTK
jgi:hypothetical protein